MYVSKGESGLNNTLSYTVGTPSASRAPLSDGLQDGTQTLAINYIRRGGGGEGGCQRMFAGVVMETSPVAESYVFSTINWPSLSYTNRASLDFCT